MHVITAVALLAAVLSPCNARSHRPWSTSVVLQSRTREQPRQPYHQLQPTEFLQPEACVRGASQGRGLLRHPGFPRGGARTSNTAVLVEAVADATIQSASIVGWVGAAEYLAERFVPSQFLEMARLGLWVVAVFVSGAATEGPRRWLSSSQLLNIEQPLSEDWYATVRKPSWNPPNWLFPIMWIPLKILQVFACYEMWTKLPVRRLMATPVIVYAVYKSLGDVWNKVFFVRRRIGLATAVISVYFLTLLVGIKLFYDVSPTAGYLFAPTAAWVAVATTLQWSTWLLNRDKP